jgi:sensor histidine kinase YesM
MSLYNLFFSKKPLTRYLRHIAFWGIRFFYTAFEMHSRIYWLSAPAWLNWMTALKVSLYETALEMILVYAIVYVLFPVYFNRRRYLSFTLGTIGFLCLIFLITYPHQVRYMCENMSDNPYLRLWFCLLFFTGYSLTPCLLLLAARLFKVHFEKMKERETLSRETADVEFKLLKAQVHPHFLFNTLNNIYSFALYKSPMAGELLSELSDMMRYMIYDCEASLMPLEKELKMLNGYIGLEKARYGDRLDMQVKMEGDFHNWRIAPLLMIPLIENCFKHGVSQMLQQPWVKLRILAHENTLDFQLSNSKPSTGTPANGKNGIGLKNIKKRLELLYHGQYELNIDPTSDSFSVRMLVPLEKGSPVL